MKADHEQWALSLGLQGDASGHFNDARMYQARDCAFGGFVRNAQLHSQLSTVAHRRILQLLLREEEEAQ